MTSDDNFLARWSRRKHAVRKGEAAPEPLPDRAPAVAVPAPAAKPPADAGEPATEPEPLPPVESLTPESDFAPFMRKDVDPVLRRQALKTLFRDPRHNVMDGLDVYIDDFSKPDPLPPEWLGKLAQMARLGDYHATEAKLKAEAEAERDAAANQEISENQEVEPGIESPPEDLPEAPSPARESKPS